MRIRINTDVSKPLYEKEKTKRTTILNSSRRFINRHLPKIVVTLSLAVIIYIAWIIYTTPEPYKDTVPEGKICLVDDTPEDTFDYSQFTAYEDLFPENNEYGKDGEILIEEDPTLFALPSTALNMQALPYFPPITTPLPIYKHIPSMAPRSAPYIPFLVPFLYSHPSITPPTSNNNNSSTCVPAIPVDEPNTLYLLAIGLLLRIFIKHD